MFMLLCLVVFIMCVDGFSCIWILLKVSMVFGLSDGLIFVMYGVVSWRCEGEVVECFW